MWPWRRKDAASPATPPVRRGEWRTLQPIQRIVPAHPLVNPVQRFADSLTSWQNPSYLAPLAHQVGPAEPAGVIADYARPTPVDLPVARPPRRRPSTVGGVWSRLRDVVAQRTAESASTPSEVPPPVEPESPVSGEPEVPDPAMHEEPAPVVHEALATPEPAMRGEPVAAPEPVVREDLATLELAEVEKPAAAPVPTLHEEPVATAGATTTVESTSPTQPTRPTVALDLKTPAVPNRVEVAGGGSSTPQVQRTVAPEAVVVVPVTVQRELAVKSPDRQTPSTSVARPVVNRVVVDRTKNPVPPPEPLVQPHVADVVAQEPEQAADIAEPEPQPDEPDIVTAPAPLIGELAHERHEPSPGPPSPLIPLVQSAVHPVAGAVEQAPDMGSTPVVADFRTSEPRVSATVQPMLESSPVPLVRQEFRTVSREVDEYEAPAVQRIADSPIPLVQQVVETPATPPIRHEPPLHATAQRPVIEPRQVVGTHEDVSLAPPPPAPSMVQRQVSPVTETGSPEIVVARRRGLGAPILPDSEPRRQLPELPRPTLAAPPTTAQRMPETVPLPETVRPEAVPSETVRLAHLEPLADHRPAVQRLQEAPSRPPVERIELVGERPLSVNRVESGPGDVPRPWVAGAPAVAPARTPSETRSETHGAPVAVPPIVSRLIEGAPLAVTTSPAVEAPVQRVEQVVRTSTAVQREEIQDVPAAAPSPAAAPAGEPEDLVKKLYDPLLRRLKAELWLDRERRGALTDLWH